ncbi:MAG: hypothetical protein IT371_27310 [Deltaproteobacteria bacterium]|nr:hypothetical protein [Deltaproteobacteria bacterium]
MKHLNRRRWLVCWTIAATAGAVGCKEPTAPNPDPTKTPEKQSAAKKPAPAAEKASPDAAPAGEHGGADARADSLAEHMRGHFGAATTLRNAVIAGRLDGLAAPSKALADDQMESKKAPEPWQPRLKAMREAAVRAGKAKSVAEAASAVAELGATCGGCHRQTKTEVNFPLGTVPPEGKDRKSHMARHAWAMSRLWEGLVGPSDYAWKTATAVLAEEPLKSHEIPPKSAGKEASVLADEVHKVGRRAGAAKTVEQRAKVYDALVRLCARCHALFAD